MSCTMHCVKARRGLEPKHMGQWSILPLSARFLAGSSGASYIRLCEVEHDLEKTLAHLKGGYNGK